MPMDYNLRGKNRVTLRFARAQNAHVDLGKNLVTLRNDVLRLCPFKKKPLRYEAT